MMFVLVSVVCLVFFFQAEDGIRDLTVTGVQTCALPIYSSLGGYHPIAWKRFRTKGRSTTRTVRRCDTTSRTHTMAKSMAPLRSTNSKQIGRASCRERV